MNTHSEAKGTAYILAQALLWGLFPVITVVLFGSLPPLFTLAGGTFFSGLLFGAMITIRRRWRELKDTSALPDLFLTAFLLGVVYYFFIFIGLTYTSPANASIIALSETFFSYLFFTTWKKEHYSGRYIIGSLFMITGALIVLLPHVRTFQLGDVLVLIASAIAPFGNYFQRRARQKVSSETVLFFRALITVPTVLIAAYLLGERVYLSELRQGLPLLIISGVFLMGVTKIFWIEGIHRISVTKANALSAIAPLFAIIFSWLILAQSPTVWQLLSLLPIGVGVYLLNEQKVTHTV